MKRIFISLLIYILLSLVVCQLTVAQTPYQLKESNKNEWCDSKCKLSIGAYIVGSGLDIHSSQGKKELNPLVINDQGRIHTGKAIAYKSLGLGATLALQKKYPNKMFWVRIFGGAIFSAVSIHNYSQD